MCSWGVPEQGWRKGPWTPEEDKLLIEYVNFHGEGRWSSVARSSGLNRNGKSCRLRWVNYLRPGLKRGQITSQEEAIILELLALWGNKWSTIARYLPGRTDNEIKNYWRTHFKKKEKLSRKQQNRDGQGLKNQQGQDDEMRGSLLDQVESSEAHANQDTVHMYPTMEEYLLCPEISQDAAESIGQDAVWGGLWNLDY